MEYFNVDSIHLISILKFIEAANGKCTAIIRTLVLPLIVISYFSP